MTSPRRRGLIALAAVAWLLLTLSLGIWQMSRAAEKLAVQASIDQKNNLGQLSTAQLFTAEPVETLLHRRVKLQGKWLTDATIFLENRQMNGRPGFFVVTPLLSAESPKAVLVLRGWIPRNFQDREALAPVDTPTRVVEIAGRLVGPPSDLYDFGGVERGPIRQNLDVVRLTAELDVPLLALAVQQEGGTADGLQRSWSQPNVGVEKHHGYAFQWFGLSALIAVLYVWFQIVQPIRSRRRPAKS